jgi:hypothetical protein
MATDTTQSVATTAPQRTTNVKNDPSVPRAVSTCSAGAWHDRRCSWQPARWRWRRWCWLLSGPSNASWCTCPDGSRYHPCDGPARAARRVLRTEDGLELDAWWLPAPATRAPAVLVASGNGGSGAARSAGARPRCARPVRAPVRLPRLRRQPGSPSEEGLARDVRAARRYLLEEAEVPPDRLLYFGESLGAAVVTELATEHPPAGSCCGRRSRTWRRGSVHYPLLPVRPSCGTGTRWPSTSRRSTCRPPSSTAPRTRSSRPSRAGGWPRRREPPPLVAVRGADHNDLVLVADDVVQASSSSPKRRARDEHPRRAPRPDELRTGLIPASGPAPSQRGRDIGWWPAVVTVVGFVLASGEFPTAVSVLGALVQGPALVPLTRLGVDAPTTDRGRSGQSWTRSRPSPRSRANDASIPCTSSGGCRGQSVTSATDAERVTGPVGPGGVAGELPVRDVGPPRTARSLHLVHPRHGRAEVRRPAGPDDARPAAEDSPGAMEERPGDLAVVHQGREGRWRVEVSGTPGLRLSHWRRHWAARAPRRPATPTKVV